MRSTDLLRRSLAAALLLLAAGTGPARAGGEPRTHDGFFLRLSTGVAATRAEISDATGKLEVTGPAGDLNIAVGGMVGTNFVLHGTIWGWSATDPDGKVSISGFGSGSGTLNATLTMSAIGVGATYYFMPSNFYLSYSVGMASLSGDGDLDGKTKSGFGFDATVGKEWWVGDAWGLGVNGDVTYFSSKDDTILGVDETWSGPSYGLRFSATFN
jgi:hypothetical protein